MQMPKVIFVPCVNSHSFERREIEVYEEVKVGRSVARCKTSPDNAIFDCKVLSRSHAVMWFQDGFVWIKDTSSSNGTFINSTRLSRGGEESEPFKIQSGDKIQFGVDVMEAKKKDGGGNPITHGCIIAKATVVIPDSLIPNPTYVINNPLLNSKSVSSSSETLDCIDEDQDILDLHAAIKNAMNRENLLHLRLQELEGRLGTAIEAAELGWQALIKEDKLLARIELLENQLEIFTRNPTEDQNKILRLESEKHDYQIHAKDSLRAICLEKSDVARKCSDLENSLTNARMEVTHHRNLHETVQAELIKAQDEVRRKTVDLETKEAENLLNVDTKQAEHQTAVDELTKNIEDMTSSKTELVEQRDLLEKQLDSIANENAQKIESLQSSIAALREELESAADKKEVEESLTEENSALKNENYKLQEELMRLREELESGSVPNMPVEIETDSAADKSFNRQYSEASTNTDQSRDSHQREASSEEQDGHLNPVNIRDSMSQTEKWFDAISPSSSKSDILSASFSAGDKRYRSLRANRREGPRPWSNSNAFEGSIAHAMALIESLDDIKSSCVKFREETESNDVELSIDSGEMSVTEESPSKLDISNTISPPPRRRNSYREACEEEEETAGTTTVRPDDTFDDASEADEHYELAPEDSASGERPSVILNKVESSRSSPKPPDSPIQSDSISRSGLEGTPERLKYVEEELSKVDPAFLCYLLEFAVDHWYTLTLCLHLTTTFTHSHLDACDLRVSEALSSLSYPDLDASTEQLRASTVDLVAARDRAGDLEKDLMLKQAELDDTFVKLDAMTGKVGELESAEKDQLEKLDDRKAEIESLKRDISRLKSIEEEHERMKAESARQADESSRKNEVSTLSATIQARDSEIAVLKEEIYEIVKAGEVSKNCIKTLQITVKELEDKIAGTEKDKQELSRSCSEDYEAELKKEKARHLTELAEQVGQIEAKLNEKEKMLDYLNEELREVREQSSSLQEEVETYKCGTTSLQEEIETYKCGTTSLQEEIETYKCGTTSLQEELKSYKSGAASAQVMQQELVNLQGQISQLSTLPSELHAAESKLSAMSESLEAKDSELMEVTARLNVQISEKFEEVSKLEVDIANLNNNVKREVEATILAERKVVKMNSEMTGMNDNLVAAKQEIACISATTAGLTKTVDDLRLKNYNLEDNCAEIVEARALAETENTTLKIKLSTTEQDSQEKISTLESNTYALQTELNNMKNIQNNSVSSLGEVQAELASKTADLDKLRSRNVGLESEKLALESTISELRGNIESVNANLASLSQLSTTEQVNFSEQSKALKESIAKLEKERSELLSKIEEQEIERSRLLGDTNTLQELLVKVTAERDLALNDLTTAQNEFGLMIEEEVVKQTASHQSLLVVEQEQVKTLNSQVQEFESKVSEIEKLREQLKSVSGDLVASQDEKNAIQRKFDEIDGKSERLNGKYEKDLQEIRAQLTKANKEAESQKKDSKRSKDQLLDVKATLAETQDKIGKLAEDKKSLQLQLTTPPNTPCPPPPVNSPQDTSQFDKINKLERQIAEIKKEKAALEAKPTSEQPSQVVLVTGMVGLAGVSSAVCAYIGSLYGC